MLDTNLTTQLRSYLTMLTTDVTLVPSPYTGDDTTRVEKSRQMDELLAEIADLSDAVSVADPVASQYEPSFAVTRPGTDIGVRFAGLPMGHEFTSLVLALLQVGGHEIKEDEALKKAVTTVEGHHEFVTYMSLSCVNCPTVVQALNAMSVLNPNIRHTAVEGSTFRDEVAAKGVQSVPTIFLNGEEWGSGRMTMTEILEKLDAEAASGAHEDLSQRDPYDVLVVGAGPAGAAAGVYAARKGIRTAVVGDRVGGQVLDTDTIDNLVSVPHTTGSELAASLNAHMADYELDLLEHQHATGLTPGEDGVTVHLTDGNLRSRAVILATGARWRHLGVPGEEEYRTRGVTYCPHCDGPLFRGKKVAVIGGGNSGVEAALDLAGVVEHVTVIEFLDELKADEVLLSALGKLDNVDVITGAATTSIDGDGTTVTGLSYTDRTSGQEHSIDVSGVFVQIGLLPNTEWLSQAVELNGRGEVVIDERCRTSVPGIFAAGDCTTQAYKQIITSMGSGATASLAAFDHLIRNQA